MARIQNSLAAMLLAALAAAGVFTIGSTASADQIARGKLRFVEGFERGSQRAMREGKPMLLFFTAQWCHNCHQLADEAFTHPQVVNLSRHFVCVLIDADEEPEVCQQFEVTGYPTIQFLSPRGEPINRILGKKPARQMAASMQSVLRSRARGHEEAAYAPRR